MRAALLVALALAACGDETRPLPADVDAVLESRCRRCHADPPANFAPMPLISWNDLHAASPGDPDSPVFVRVGVRIHSADFPMPPQRTDELAAFTDAEREILDLWIAAGAPPAPDPDAGP